MVRVGRGSLLGGKGRFGMAIAGVAFAVLLAILSGAVWDLTGRPALAFVPVAACAAGLVLSAGWMRVKGELR